MAGSGIFTVYLAKQFPSVKVHCFEPVKDIFKLLELNAKKYVIHSFGCTMPMSLSMCLFLFLLLIGVACSQLLSAFHLRLCACAALDVSMVLIYSFVADIIPMPPCTSWA